jgi:hypothetical protein
VLTLTAKVPRPGDFIATWAFPKSTHEYTDKGGCVSIAPKLYDGKMLEELPGRGGLLPGRCYATTLGIEGGSSGGPVFDEHGHVFAINSTGFSGMDDLGFVSHIQSIGGLSVASVMTTDGRLHEQIDVHSLIEQGAILVEHVNRKSPER